MLRQLALLFCVANCVPNTEECCPRFINASSSVSWSCPIGQSCCAGGTSVDSAESKAFCYNPKQEICCTTPNMLPAICAPESTCCYKGSSNDSVAFCCSEKNPCCGVFRGVLSGIWESACCADGHVCCPSFDNYSVPTFPSQLLQGLPGGWKQSRAGPLVTLEQRQAFSTGCADVNKEFCCPRVVGGYPTSLPCPLGTLCCPHDGCCIGKNATTYKCVQTYYCPI